MESFWRKNVLWLCVCVCACVCACVWVCACVCPCTRAQCVCWHQIPSVLVLSWECLLSSWFSSLFSLAAELRADTFSSFKRCDFLVPWFPWFPCPCAHEVCPLSSSLQEFLCFLCSVVYRGLQSGCFCFVLCLSYVAIGSVVPYLSLTFANSSPVWPLILLLSWSLSSFGFASVHILNVWHGPTVLGFFFFDAVLFCYAFPLCVSPWVISTGLPSSWLHFQGLCQIHWKAFQGHSHLCTVGFYF